MYLPPYKTGCTPKYTGTCYDGLSMWQKGSTEARSTAPTTSRMGTVYIPNANLRANGTGGGAEVNINGIVVANTVTISGTFDFNIKVPLNVPGHHPRDTTSGSRSSAPAGGPESAGRSRSLQRRR